MIKNQSLREFVLPGLILSLAMFFFSLPVSSCNSREDSIEINNSGKPKQINIFILGETSSLQTHQVVYVFSLGYSAPTFTIGKKKTSSHQELALKETALLADGINNLTACRR